MSTTDRRQLRFYSTRGSLGFLSNFYMRPMLVDGEIWASVEHFYQAAKSDEEVHRRRVQQAPTAKQAARLGRSGPLRDDWRTRRLPVMRIGLLAKFCQHSDLRGQLLETRPHHLVEASPTDRFWGCGADGTGRNHLGRLLVELRELLDTPSSIC